MWVVLIVACIPPIRKLLIIGVGKLSTTITSLQTRAPRLPAVELRTPANSGRRNTKTGYVTNADNESEEQILGHEYDVRKTTHIDVEYCERVDSRSERIGKSNGRYVPT